MGNTTGKLIAIEGVDGCGKTTLQIKLVTLFMRDKIEVIATKEPGGTAIGDKIRNVLSELGESATPETEFLLFAASRAQHFSEVVIPALKKNKIVISDRMADSSVAYQGHGRGGNINMINSVNNWATQNRKPDIVFHIYLDTETAINRMVGRGKSTIFEERYKKFIPKVIEGFDAIFKNRENVIVLDGTKTPEELAQEAYTQIKTCLKI